MEHGVAGEAARSPQIENATRARNAGSACPRAPPHSRRHARPREPTPRACVTEEICRLGKASLLQAPRKITAAPISQNVLVMANATAAMTASGKSAVPTIDLRRI